MQALDRDGKPVEFIAVDFHARVIQHEWDHSNGKLYLDRMADFSLSLSSPSSLAFQCSARSSALLSIVFVVVKG